MPRVATVQDVQSPSPTARLVVIDGPGVGQKYALHSDTTIGRSLACDLVLDDAEISRQHAVVRRDGARFLIEDRGSRNGTKVNGRPVERPVDLEYGDKIRLGPHVVLQLTTFDPVEDHLLQRQRLETLGRLTTGIAHDLNNMLGAVTASASFMRQLDAQERAGADGEECLDDIETAARRAADLAARLLTFARARPAREATNISELALDAVRLARRTFDRSIQIGAEVTPSLHVNADPSQLHQVVMNLLVNARDAVVAGDGSRVAVRVARDGAGTVVLEVEDDGCGMEAATVARVFEPFFTTKRAGVGFGVGLATVKDVVESHGGVVNVRSAIGRGTNFLIHLPEVEPATRRHRRPTHDVIEAVRMAASDHATLLLVDDEVVMQRSLGRILRRAGFAVEVCADGESALECARGTIDLVILDLDLPRMPGHRVLRALREAGCDVPVVAISGHRDALERDQGPLRDIASFLAKPFEPQRLVQAVRDALGDTEPTVDDPTATLP